MKKKNLLMCIMLLAFISCKKGDTGEMGPAGPKGDTGAQGPSGNANVIGTNQVTISNWAWDGTAFYVANISAAGITQDIVDKGMVQVFREYSAGNWTPLPDINGQNSTTFIFRLGNITLYNGNADFSVPINPGNINFRVVIISSLRISRHPEVNWKDYSQAMNALRLEE
jgi:hypothetical protein